MRQVKELVAGIDIGTGGVRVVVCDGVGAIAAEAERPLRSVREGQRFEQDPQEWWDATVACLRGVAAQVCGTGEIVAVAVAATSGTLCLLDEQGDPKRPALMYADGRAQAEAQVINDVAADFCARFGYRFDASWGLPKLLWLARVEPEHLRDAAHIAHAGDIITGRLCGDYGVTDITQALKTGYDVLDERWPALIEDELGLPRQKLPRVVVSGTGIGRVTAEAAAETGLAAGTLVVAGMTDGCASQVAGGAVRPGQWLSVLGTTLVFKGVSTDLLHDPAGRIYSHRHPAGFWLPGAASNTGGEALARWPTGQLAGLDAQVAGMRPTDLLLYPLRRTGERFPFSAPDATGFVVGTPRSDVDLYAATLEGVAFVERLAFEVIAGLGAPIDRAVLTTGGGARSRVWTQLRADILGRPLLVVQASGAAYGAAVLAAGASLHPDVVTATAAMVRVEREIFPRSTRTAEYDEHYTHFIAACRERGYLAQPA